MISWLITDLKFSYLIIPIIIIWFITFVNAEENERGERGIWLFVATTILGGLSSLIIILGAVSANHVSESTESNEPWRQIYNNELDAPISMSYYGKNTFSTNSPLTDDNISDLRDIYYDGGEATIFIGTSDDASSRTVRVVEIEGDLNNASTITKIEYRKATTVHKKTAWLTGESKPANYQGDVRITLSNKKDSAKTNSLFGD